jgi:hypothetical protein
MQGFTVRESTWDSSLMQNHVDGRDKPGHDGKLHGRYSEFPASDEKSTNALRKAEYVLCSSYSPDRAAPWPTLNEEKQMGKGRETFCTQLETRVDFF